MERILKMIVAVHSRILDVQEKERGATATEYAMLIAFIVVALAAVMVIFGQDLGTFFGAIGGKIKGWSTTF